MVGLTAEVVYRRERLLESQSTSHGTEIFIFASFILFYMKRSSYFIILFLSLSQGKYGYRMAMPTAVSVTDIGIYHLGTTIQPNLIIKK